jgi:hypothetical protein
MLGPVATVRETAWLSIVPQSLLTVHEYVPSSAAVATGMTNTSPSPMGIATPFFFHR